MKVKLTVRPNYRRGLLWGHVVTNNAAFEESQYSPNAHWEPPTKIEQTAELGTGKGKASKMPDFELEPVRLSSQDKIAGNLQREERQPETEFNQVVGGVLAPSGSTSSSSTKSTWAEDRRRKMQQLEEFSDSAWRRSRTLEERQSQPNERVEAFFYLWTRSPFFLATCRRK